jgi:hypothetical protein
MDLNSVLRRYVNLKFSISSSRSRCRTHLSDGWQSQMACLGGGIAGVRVTIDPLVIRKGERKIQLCRLRNGKGREEGSKALRVLLTA